MRQASRREQVFGFQMRRGRHMEMRPRLWVEETGSSGEGSRPEAGAQASSVRAGGSARLCSRPLPVSPAQHEALSEYRPILSEAHRLQHQSSMADKKLVLIPVIFICLRVWSTVRFVLTLCGSPAVQTPVLVVLHVRTEVCPPLAPPSRRGVRWLPPAE